MSESYRLLSDSLLLRGDEEIRKALERATGLALSSRRSEMLAAIKRSGFRFGVRLPDDGSEEFYVNDALVLTFGPTDLGHGDDNVVTATRRVRHWQAL